MKDGLEGRDIHIILPESMAVKIDERIVRGEYRSKQEFIDDAVRRRLEELEKREGTEPNTGPHAPIAREVRTEANNER